MAGFQLVVRPLRGRTTFCDCIFRPHEALEASQAWIQARAWSPQAGPVGLGVGRWLLGGEGGS